jgi:hypothetical protein
MTVLLPAQGSLSLGISIAKAIVLNSDAIVAGFRASLPDICGGHGCALHPVSQKFAVFELIVEQQHGRMG